MQELQGQVPADQIAKWKEQYGKVFNYQVDWKIAYFRPVDRSIYSLATSKISVSPAKFNEIVIEQTWLGGCEELKKNDSYFFGLIDFVEEMMNKKKGSLGES